MVESVYTAEQIETAVKVLETIPPETLQTVLSLVQHITPERLLEIVQAEELREKKVSRQVMTPRIAILALEMMAIDMVEAMGEMKAIDPMEDVLAQRVAAIDEAQRALKQQMKGDRHD